MISSVASNTSTLSFAHRQNTYRVLNQNNELYINSYKIICDSISSLIKFNVLISLIFNFAYTIFNHKALRLSVHDFLGLYGKFPCLALGHDGVLWLPV